VRDVDAQKRQRKRQRYRQQAHGIDASAYWHRQAQAQDHQYLALCESDEQVHLTGAAVLKVLTCLGVDTSQYNSVVEAMESLRLTGATFNTTLLGLSAVINRELVDPFSMRLQGRTRTRRDSGLPYDRLQATALVCKLVKGRMGWSFGVTIRRKRPDDCEYGFRPTRLLSGFATMKELAESSTFGNVESGCSVNPQRSVYEVPQRPVFEGGGRAINMPQWPVYEVPQRAVFEGGGRAINMAR
jgi:hypothetical protein